jgi:hypothetical protein
MEMGEESLKQCMILSFTSIIIVMQGVNLFFVNVNEVIIVDN